MSTKIIKISNMCCGRCIAAVKAVLDDSGIKYKEIELGTATLTGEFSEKVLETNLKKAGFELIKSKAEEITERIKIAIRNLFVDAEKRDFNSLDLREYLEVKVQLPYKRLAEIFSHQEGRTVEKYIILQRIEKVKGMITETPLSFTEIAFKLGYNSLSHLSRQFKEIEGSSMHNYRLNPKNKRNSIDKI